MLNIFVAQVKPNRPRILAGVREINTCRMRDEDIATDVAAAIKIKGQAILRRSLAETLKRTRNAVGGDSAFHLVSISQTLTRCCRLTVHKSVPAVRIHLAPAMSRCEPKTPDEIVQTLDAEGASDHLPFMSEMLEFCGRTFRVSRRALTICISGPDTGVPRRFRVDDVVTLDSVRCSGTAHDGCLRKRA